MPYSDNLYSMIDDDSDVEPVQDAVRRETVPQQHHRQLGEDPEHDADADEGVEDHVLSPSDGYFRSSSNPSESSWPPTNTVATASSPPAPFNVPRVPNVWVTDPTLEQGSTAEGKAREAEQERLNNSQSPSSTITRNETSTGASFAGSHISRPTYPPISTPSLYGHHSTPSTSSRGTHSQYTPASASASAYTPSATSSYRPYPPRRGVQSERSSLIPSDAPPAYTPSPTTPPSSSSSNPTTSPRSYNTFPERSMGRDETQRLLPNGPESMGNPLDEDEDITPVWRERVTRALFLRRRSCEVVILGLVLIAFTIGFLVSVLRAVIDEGNMGSHRPRPGDPTRDYPDIDHDISWNPPGSCRNLQYKRPTESFDLAFSNDRRFNFIQDISKHDSQGEWRLKVDGDVIFRRTGEGTPGPSIVLEAVTNHESIEITTQFDSNTQDFRVTVPPYIQWAETSWWPCVRIRATVWVPADGSLESLAADTVHLGITLLDNLSIRIADTTNLQTVVGPVIAATDGSENASDVGDGAPESFNFASRKIDVRTTSSPIKGSWPLYDELHLQTTSGDITVGIDPKPASKDSLPADLTIKSTSGHVEAWEPACRRKQQPSLAADQEDAIPPRDYRVDVHTASGAIRGALPFSSMGRFHSVSGTLSLDLLPVLGRSLANQTAETVVLETHTTSGSVTVHVLDPLWIKDDDNGGKGYYPHVPNSPNAPNTPNLPNIPDPPKHPDSKDDDKPERGVDVPIPIFIPIGDRDPYDLPAPPPAKHRAVAASMVAKPKDKDKDKPRSLRCLQARHTTTSASVWLRYPAAWEGDLDLRSLSGSLRARGDGVKIIKDENGFPGINGRLLARKGEEGGQVVLIKSLSGSIDVLVGNE